jgi:hypothetical protein
MLFLRLKTFLVAFFRHAFEPVLLETILAPNLHPFFRLSQGIFLRRSGFGIASAADDLDRIVNKKVRAWKDLVATPVLSDREPVAFQ